MFGDRVNRVERVEISSSRGESFLPVYADNYAAGFDIKADLSDEKYRNEGECSLLIYPGERVLIPTSLRVDIPDNFEIQIRSKSGLCLNNGIIVLNSPGTIDSNYRREIGVILYNADKQNFRVKDGMKIAQGVLAPVFRADFILVDELNKVADRGGFGSTGL